MKNLKRANIVVAVLLAALALFGIQRAWADAVPQQAMHAQEIAQAATPAPPNSSVVTGSVVLKGGASVTGGTVGSALAIEAAFQASSPSAPVTEMRTAARYGGNCVKDMSSVAWEPWVPARTFTVTVGLNFIGLYVSAQFRDANGNLSPIVCDDISVEGMPAMPTAPAATSTPTAVPRASVPRLCGSGALLFVAGLVIISRRRWR